MTGVIAALLAAARTLVQVALGATSAGTASTTTVAYPAGIVAGMGLIMHCMLIDSTAAAMSAPSGWTAIANTGAGTNRGFAFFKQAVGGESGTIDVSASVTADTAFAGRITRTTNTCTGFEVAGGSNASGSASTISCRDLTSTKTLELAVQLFNFNGASTTTASVTGESGTDYTDFGSNYNNGASCNLDIQSGTLAAAGAVTGGTTTLGAARTQRGTISFALLP